MKPVNKLTLAQLRRKFRTQGIYFRQPNLERRRNEGQLYKKGYEVRIPLQSDVELRETQNTLTHLSFSTGKPFKKGSQYILPIYGRDQVARFVKLFKVHKHKSVQTLKARNAMK
jgi:hypothetical protein